MDAKTTIEIARWVIDQGLSGTAESVLLDGLCRRMVGAGVPLHRGYVAQRTLHPEIGGHGYTWHRTAEEIGRQDFARSGDTHADFLRSPFHHMLERRQMRLRQRIDGANAPLPYAILDDLAAEGATDYYACLTRFADWDEAAPVAGMITSWTTDAPQGFRDDDIEAIENLLPAFGLALKSASLRRVAENLVHAYLGRDAGARVLSGDIERGTAETIRAVLWFCDLRGFTRIADSGDGSDLIPMLNAYFEQMVEALHAQGGEVLKFMGDGLLAIFRDTDNDDARGACSAALAAADDAFARLGALNAERETQGVPVTRFNVGLHVGEVLYGNIGARDRLDFTVVGRAVNEVSRIEAMCRALEQDILISSDFAEAADGGAGGGAGRLVSLGKFALRGVRRPRELYTLMTPGGEIGAGAFGGALGGTD